MIANITVFSIVHTLLIVFMFTFDCTECLASGGLWKQVGFDINGEAAYDESGWSIAMSSDGNTIVVGAVYNDGNVFNSGHARVHSLSSTFNVWGQIGSDINGEYVNDDSGVSVAISADGKTIAVGALFNNGTGTQSGHVRAYTYTSNATSTIWRQLGSDINGEASLDLSGFAVTMSDDGKMIAIGAPKNKGNGTDSGHVRVYTYISTDWVQVGLDINGEAPGDQSGYSIAMSGDGKTIAIGAPYNDGNGPSAGHVRVYTLSSTTFNWQKVGADIDGEVAFDTFGWSVALSADGKTLAVGAPRNDGFGNDSGHARVYAYSSTTNNWEQLGNDINGKAPGDYFGLSVVLSADGKTIAVGAPYNDDNGIDSGHVRVFSFRSATNNWEQIGLDINGEAANDYSGDVVAISNDGATIAIGATGNDGNGELSGHVRVYKYESAPTKSPTKIPTKSPTTIPTKVPSKSPIIIVQPTEILPPSKNDTTTECDDTCGIFGLNIICPFTFCGTFGRLLKLCDC